MEQAGKAKNRQASHRETRKKKEFILNYRILLFVSIVILGITFVAEGLVKLLAATIFKNDIMWYVVIGGVFIILGLLIAGRESGRIRDFLSQ